MTPFLEEKDLLVLLKECSLYSNAVIKALDQAKVSHKDHTRDKGTPYLEEHIYPIVKDIITAGFKDEKIIIGALLHDVIEDDPNMTKEKFRELFGEEIYKIIEVLTKPDIKTPTQKDKYERNKHILERIEKGPRQAKIIKLADHVNNLLSSPNFTEPKYVRYIEETNDFYLPFAKAVSEYYYKKLKKIVEAT